jgi:hypothetical protein
VSGKAADTGQKKKNPAIMPNSDLLFAEVPEKNKCSATLASQGHPRTEEDWAEFIRPDLQAGAVSYISAGHKLIAAKKALKKTDSSFIHLVEAQLGWDLDTAERWMDIARNPVLSDSATSRNLPTSWTTLYALSRLSPEILRGYIADGTVHARLTCRDANRLVRGANANGKHGRGVDREHSHECNRDERAVDPQHQDHTEQKADPVTQSTAQDNVVGENSPGEIARKLARKEELEREKRQLEIRIQGYESEVAELKARLGPETPIHHQQRLFRQALRSLQKSEQPATLEKDRRSLKQSATTDFVELVRSVTRDGLKLERLDLVYRPELRS